ncbi:MAG: hypothetical protein JNL98_08600 [Bryobacterales bacterium]|nr:hypothetical protein [Bryobacterales bacterium]
MGGIPWDVVDKGNDNAAQALEEQLQRLAVRHMEERDARGYRANPQRKEEYEPWEDVAVWPAQ